MVIAGSVESGDPADADAWIIKIDENGNELWVQTYGGTRDDYAQSVIQGNNGGYVITGTTHTRKGGMEWLRKINENGRVLWSLKYDTSTIRTVNTTAESIVQGVDGGYVLAGSISEINQPGDAWIIKIDEKGNALWKQEYGGAEDEFVYSAINGNNGGYLFIGSTGHQYAENMDAWVVKTDENGNAPAMP